MCCLRRLSAIGGGADSDNLRAYHVTAIVGICEVACTKGVRLNIVNTLYMMCPEHALQLGVRGGGGAVLDTDEGTEAAA